MNRSNSTARTLALAIGAPLASLFALVVIVTAVGSVISRAPRDGGAERNSASLAVMGNVGSSGFRHAGSTLRTSYATAWETSAEARRALETRTEALLRWASEQGGELRIVSTDVHVRMRNERGGRLRTPLARFERTVELRVMQSGREEALQQALDRVQVQLASRQ